VMNANNPEVVRASYETGVRLFDTAAYYQGGKNERMVGDVIKELGARDDVTIATKVYNPSMRRGDPRKAIRVQVNECLDRLQMNHVDILYVHVVDSADFAKDEEVRAAMEEARESGKTRFIGLSTHKNMSEVIEAVTETGWYDVVLASYNISMDGDERMQKAIRQAAAKGIGIIAMKTQAGGRRYQLPDDTTDYDSRTMNQAALKWVLRNEHVTAAIPGYTTFEHMREDFEVASGIEYNEKEKCLLGDCNIKIGLGFCRQCDLCLGDCPAGVDVPTLMRTHMYAAQYANFQHARATLDDIERGRGLEACVNCGRCKVRCPHSVDVAAKIEELRLIYA